MQTKNLTPIKAIRAKCLDCSASVSGEVKNCHIKDCPLWPYRLGKNPNRTGRKMTEEQRLAAAENLRLAREAKESK